MFLLATYGSFRELGMDVATTIIFGVVSIGLMVLGFKAFDWITPELNVEKELSEKHNLAVAIVIAAAILGISFIIGHIVSTPATAN